MNEKMPDQNIKESLVEANPELDQIIEEIDECIAVMIACHYDSTVPAYQQALERKSRLQEKNSDALFQYLEPYRNITWESNAQASTTLEWARYRVAYNWDRKGLEG